MTKLRLRLLASSAALALAAATPRPAHALFGVGDLVFDPTAFTNAVQQLAQMEQQLAQLEQTYQALAHTTGVNSLAPSLGLPSVQDPLGSVAQLPGLLSGTSLGGAAQQFLGANRYYQPQGNDFTALELQRRAQATANVQAIAQQNLQATQDRLAGLQDLQAQIDASPTTQDMGAIQARLAAESNFIQTQQAQAQQLALLQRAQEQVSQQREAEWQRQSADALFNATKPMSQSQRAQGTPSAAYAVPTFTAGAPGS